MTLVASLKLQSVTKRQGAQSASENKSVASESRIVTLAH